MTQAKDGLQRKVARANKPAHPRCGLAAATKGPSRVLTTTAAAFPRLGPRSDRAAAALELGLEPAIQLGEDRIDRNERRRASLKWLAGAALTGVCGVALIGAALYFDLDSQYDFAEAPEFASTTGETQQEGVNLVKSDRLLRPLDIVADKQTYKVGTTIKIGDKEVVKARAFTRLQTTLTMTPTGFADLVPAFNALKLTNRADAPDAAPPDPGPAQDDVEVSFRTSDLSLTDAEGAAGELSQAEAQAQVIETLKKPADAVKAATQSLPPQLLLMRTTQAATDQPGGAFGYATTGGVSSSAPFASIEVHMIPENVTNIGKTASSEDASPSEKLVQLRHGESLEDVLKANGATPEAASAILAAFGLKHGESPVGEGQKILLLAEETSARASPPRIARVSVYGDGQLKATVAINDRGEYASVSAQPAAMPRKNRSAEESERGGMSLYQSLYETALKQGLPKPIIDLLVRIFANDVDFQRSTAPGDSIDAFFSDPDEVSPRAELLYATMTVRDQAYRYYRFQTPDDNLVDYYDDNGRSMRKFLLRKPIAEGEMTSAFGMRYHPILHFVRMHTGIDWAAPIGTPIYAAGNGVVLKAAWDSGYGRRVEIQHANGYVTTYNHLAAFGRGIAEGVRVAQGQVVGYLGESGLATGPHLHYEVIINGNFVDPMAIKLARTREFDGKMLALFRRERDHIEALMAQAPAASATSAEKPSSPPGPTAKLN
ncbi:MAG: M23 family metallopeptidase [Hyphomicrobiales bacterium]|nr:M23 family metallopeptidase [Hyphomicrobiales bacterium]